MQVQEIKKEFETKAQEAKDEFVTKVSELNSNFGKEKADLQKKWKEKIDAVESSLIIHCYTTVAGGFYSIGQYSIALELYALSAENSMASGYKDEDIADTIESMEECANKIKNNVENKDGAPFNVCLAITSKDFLLSMLETYAETETCTAKMRKRILSLIKLIESISSEDGEEAPEKT
jgi:nucleoside-triphosphatase THEP1